MVWRNRDSDNSSLLRRKLRGEIGLPVDVREQRNLLASGLCFWLANRGDWQETFCRFRMLLTCCQRSIQSPAIQAQMSIYKNTSTQRKQVRRTRTYSRVELVNPHPSLALSFEV
jgi:hypothetical protein